MSRPAALVTAARGLGDILRITPLVRACAWLGYDVDLLLAPDYTDTTNLLSGAPEVRRIFLLPSPWSQRGPTDVRGLAETNYEVATFTVWTTAFSDRIRARRVLRFDRGQWARDGDPACTNALACELGWTGPMPPPFAVASSRRFGLEPETVAMHPGCKPDWPWKKWHGFDQLAQLLPSVVVVGTSSDLRNGATYFGRDFQFPPHVRSFAGVLDLPDTAALLQECAALVSNDSGLMHLGVALGVTTFGVFGISSPAREAMLAPNMVPITKGLPCEPVCRRGTWGRRNCDRNLECLRTLTPEDVLARMRAEMPDLLSHACE